MIRQQREIDRMRAAMISAVQILRDPNGVPRADGAIDARGE
jgi:hypothetical protein